MGNNDTLGHTVLICSRNIRQDCIDIGVCVGSICVNPEKSDLLIWADLYLSIALGKQLNNPKVIFNSFLAISDNLDEL